MQDIKNYFSIFENYKRENNGKDLIYLDSSASSLTPDIVIAKMDEYYFHYRSNIDRAISKIAMEANKNYDQSKKVLAEYLNCEEEDLIWTSGATNSSNMLTDLISRHDDEYKTLKEGDEILTTISEHHSSLLPLQELAKRKGLKLKFLEINKDFDLDLQNLENLVSNNTKIVSINLVSNVLGTINNIPKIITEIKKINPKVFVICDMTSAFGHIKINLKEMKKYIDAGYFSFHKAFGPTGVGVLFLKREISRSLKPVVFGGGMIAHVYRDYADYRSDIKLFEAGTSNISGVIGAGEAVRFLMSIENKFNVLEHNQRLTDYLIKRIKQLENESNLKINIFSAEAERNIGIVSIQIFIKEQKEKGEELVEIHPHDVADILSRDEIAIRAGHHCAEPLMQFLNIKNGLTRISLHVYNTEDDINKIIESLKKIETIFKK